MIKKLAVTLFLTTSLAATGIGQAFAADSPAGDPTAPPPAASPEEFKNQLLGKLEKQAIRDIEVINKTAAADPRYAKAVATEMKVEKGTGPADPRTTLANPDGALAGCNAAWVTVYMNNVSGSTIWRYRQQVDWCSNGSQVTSISPAQISGYVYGWAAALGWSYEGVRNNAQWDYYGNRWVYRTYTQGAFHYCPPRVICVQKVYPNITIDTYGNGNWDYYWSRG
ncbi:MULTISPECIES: hypothetical protein [Nonomuraea]|uniref:Secreted protein n=1 Tax=Nonomuraea mangrovi TaxID=2316207 RepID=A0ABW4T3Z2_9ACTN